MNKLMAPLLLLLAIAFSGCRGYGPPLGEKFSQLTTGSDTSTLAEGLLSASAEERQWSVIRLSEKNEPRVIDALTQMLSPRIEPVPLVRATSAKALRQLGDARAVPALTSALGDNDPMVRAESARSLGVLGGDREVEALSRMLRTDSNGTVRLESAIALRQIGGAQVLPALAYALGDYDITVAFAAYDALIALTNQDLPASRKAWENWIQSGGKS